MRIVNERVEDIIVIIYVHIFFSRILNFSGCGTYR